MKKIIVLTLLFLFVLTNQALAHTGLESSDPEDGSTVSESLSDITLTFETTIEQTSTFELQDSNGEIIPVTDISIADNVMEGKISEPLENDQYVVSWNIIGVDGHPIQGTFSFAVDVPVTESATEEDNTATDETDEAGESTEQSDTAETETEAASETADGQDEGSNGLMIILIIVIILVVASIVWLRRKK